MNRLLADRNLRLLFVGQSLSMFGDSVMLLALAIWVKDLTHSNAAAGLVILVVLLPSLAAPLSVLFGAGVAWAVVAIATLVQTNTPPHLQGRVSSATELLFHGPQTLSIGLGALAVAGINYRLLLGGMTLVLLACSGRLTLSTVTSRPINAKRGGALRPR